MRIRATRSKIAASKASFILAGTNTRVPLVHTWPAL